MCCQNLQVMSSKYILSCWGLSLDDAKYESTVGVLISIRHQGVHNLRGQKPRIRSDSDRPLRRKKFACLQDNACPSPNIAWRPFHVVPQELWATPSERPLVNRGRDKLGSSTTGRCDEREVAYQRVAVFVNEDVCLTTKTMSESSMSLVVNHSLL